MLLSLVEPSLPSRTCSLLSKFPNQQSTSLLVGVRIHTATVPTALSAQMLLEVPCTTPWESRHPIKGNFWKLHTSFTSDYYMPNPVSAHFCGLSVSSFPLLPSCQAVVCWRGHSEGLPRHPARGLSLWCQGGQSPSQGIRRSLAENDKNECPR